MGLLALQRLISKHRQYRRRRQIQGRSKPPPSPPSIDGSAGSLAKRKGSPCEQDDSSQTGKRIRYSVPQLPEDIWQHIHSLVPTRDAARAACVCRAFLRSWRCCPNLTFHKSMFGLSESLLCRSRKTRDYNSKVDRILGNHSSVVGVKTLRLEVYGPYDSSNSSYLDRWLQICVQPGIERLTVTMHATISNPISIKEEEEYKTFPCSHLSDGRGSSMYHLHLVGCAFRPAPGTCCGLSNLRRIFLFHVRITGDELGCLLSNSFSLDWLELVSCNEIVSVELPACLLRLTCLNVSKCRMLQAVESKAPNISSFMFDGEQVRLLLGESLQMKMMLITHPRVLHYACTKLLPSTPNLEELTMHSLGEMVDTPMLPNKFLHLKTLCISFRGWNISSAYDFFSLVSFLDASPSLQTFHLDAPRLPWMRDSILQDTSPLRQKTPLSRRHRHLKRVNITSFCSSRMLIELVCHVLENSASLQRLTLDITSGEPRCRTPFVFGKCDPQPKHVLLEAPKASSAIQTFIRLKVPSRVKMNVLKLCDRCHIS